MSESAKSGFSVSDALAARAILEKNSASRARRAARNNTPYPKSIRFGDFAAQVEILKAQLAGLGDAVLRQAARSLVRRIAVHYGDYSSRYPRYSTRECARRVAQRNKQRGL